MSEVILNVLITQIIVICIFLAVIAIFVRRIHAIQLEKRFESFSLIANNDHEKSIFDSLLILAWKITKKFSNILKKSTVLVNYSKKYERHIAYEQRNVKSGLDYVSVKMLAGLTFWFISFITSLFNFHEISFISYIVTFIIGFYLPDLFLYIEFKKKRKRIEEDLLKAIIIMNNSFKSGRNIMQAIVTVKNELDGPIADEFQKIYLDITYGLSLDVVFNRFYDRVKLEDAKYIASSLTLLNKTGGNIVRVFATIEKSVFDKKKLRNKLNSLTASSVFVFRVLVALPFVFAGIIFILNPTYFTPLFTSGIGIFFLILIILLFSMYVFVIKRVLQVKI